MEEHDDEISHNVSVKPEDDSLADFKSPKQSSITKVTESSNSQRRKTTRKLKNPVKSQKELNKQRLERKRTVQNAQTSIESSFFKSKNSSDNEATSIAKVALVCPLCFKTFNDHDSRVLHMKICAFRNNISTEKLLEAVELQNRQEDERKALGLLAGPTVQERKKQIVSSRKVAYEESDFELALALSKSLQEVEGLNAINEIERSSETSDQIMTDATESAHQDKKRIQLERFGFANSKPPAVKTKRRKRNEITVLQTRTKEERNRILTDKISEILMGNESITQNQKTDIKCNVIKKEIHLRSPLLQEIYNKEKELWNKAKLTSNQSCFYVPSLSNCISPKVNETKEIDFHNIELSEYKKEEIRTIEKICASTDINENCNSCQNKQFTNTVITNWSSALNDSSASDIIIFVQKDKYIWAHRLVFYVQCSNILLDVTTNDTSEFSTIKEKIDWTDISYNIALAFLEFIYCGIINNYAHVLENVTSFTTLRNLARKYKVKELFTFLQRKEVEMKEEKNKENKVKELMPKETENLNLNNDNVHNSIDDSKDIELDEKEKFSTQDLKECITHKAEFVKVKLTNDTCTKQLLKGEIDLSEISILQNTNLSPDLFDDSNTSVKNNEMKNETKRSIDKISAEEIKEIDEFSVLDSNNRKSNLITENIITCKSTEENTETLANITDFSTPKRSRSSNIENTRNNLSIFIEKCRKENAKSISDLDAEILVTLTTPLKPDRNPFRVNQNDSSDTIIKGAFKDKHVLSMFDCPDDPDLKDMKTPAIANDVDMHVNLDKSDIVSKSNVEEECRSKSDSITNSIINNEKEFEDEAIHSSFSNSLHESTQSSVNMRSEEDALCSDFDTTGVDISVYSKYKKEHKHNSIVKYRSFVKKHVLHSNVKDCKAESKKNDNTDSEIISLSDTDTDTEAELSVKEYSQTDKKRLSVDYKEYEQTYQRESCGFTNESLTDDINICTFTNNMSPKGIIEDSIKNTGKNNLSTLKYSKSDSNIDLEAVRKCSVLNVNVNKRNYATSPVLMISSPFDYDNLDTYNNDDINTNKTVLRSPNFDDILENSIYLANVHIDNYGDVNDTSTQVVTKKANEENMCVADLDKIITLSKMNKSFEEKAKRNKKSTTAKESVRKFQKKSVSETSLQINKQSSRNFMSQACTRFQHNIEKTIDANRSPEFVMDSVTPPPDYSSMDTPKLHAELKKYGLKIQKRKRAARLLSYIYDELHPIVSETSNGVQSELSIISSEDDEPPMKKVNHIDNDGDYQSQLALSQEKDTQKPSIIINEEMQFDDIELSPTKDNATCIKDAFLKLLNVNKELHNKILTYEPLCINSLHAILKTSGFVCKINTLMDFLDEQCITFYVQDAKQRKGK